jgi:hypothetical protein
VLPSITSIALVTLLTWLFWILAAIAVIGMALALASKEHRHAAQMSLFSGGAALFIYAIFLLFHL